MAEKKRMTVKQIKSLLARQIAKEVRDTSSMADQAVNLQRLITLEHAEARLQFCRHLLSVINGETR